jgi:hypothetical protein
MFIKAHRHLLSFHSLSGRFNNPRQGPHNSWKERCLVLFFVPWCLAGEKAGLAFLDCPLSKGVREMSPVDSPHQRKAVKKTKDRDALPVGVNLSHVLVPGGEQPE